MAKEKKEKIHEIFEVTEKGKERVVDVEVNEKEKKPSKEQIEKENEMLKKIFITVGILIALVLVYYVFAYSVRNFDYNGLNFEIVKFCDIEPCLIVYQTSFPVLYDKGVQDYLIYIGEDRRKIKETLPYDIYIRNDPRELEENVNFTGESYILENVVINSTGDFNCNGDGIISIENMKIFYGLMGINVIKNQSLSCEGDDKYTFINLQEGNVTSVEQIGSSSCYNININNCEILKGTERFMVESFVQVNDLIEYN